MNDDLTLLRRYVDTRAQEAFAQLVRRHVDHVYSAALRQTGRDGDAAEEVTQRVFILLAEKAPLLADDPDVLLGGWLFNAARFIARDVLRKEARRARHERRAAEMADERRDARTASAATADPARDPEWQEVEAELDDAMARLAEPTRGLLVLRFFEGKTAREVGEQLGISEEAARKRVSRAVDELRAIFLRRGVVLSATALAEGLATVALVKAPEGLAASSALAASTASAATASTTAAASTTTTAAWTGGFLMASVKAKTAALLAAALLLTGGAVTVAPSFFSPTRQRTIKLADAGPSISGTVRGPDGAPVAGAELVVGSPARQAYAYDTARRPRVDALTDAAGKFTVARPAEPPYMLIVRAPAGYAELSWAALASGADVKLQPWGRIEGVVRQAGQPQPKTTVRIWRVQQGRDPSEPLVHHETETTTDAAGKFVFPRVAPGEAWVYRERDPQRRGNKSGWHYLQVEPGRTAQVTIGGSGRAVAGRVEVPPEIARFVKWTDEGNYTYEATVRREVPAARPAHAPEETPEQYRAVEEAHGRTPQGRLYNTWMFPHEFRINPDGTFVVHDLPPGKYNLTIRNFELIPEVSFLEDIAGGQATFEIPDAASTEPIALGKIDYKILPRLRPGDAAPDIDVATLDGKRWRLADHKGKVVVLVCWGAYDGREEQMAAFTRLAREYGADPRVAILGCVSTDSPQQARPYIEKLRLDFPHTPDVSLMTAYDNSWPSAVLIGRDGKIVQKHLGEKTLTKYLRQALGEGTADKVTR